MVGTRSRAIRARPMIASGAASEGRRSARPRRRLAPSFAISAMRARECRLYLALSIIAPSVNVLAGRAGNHRRSEALHRMSLSDNLRRLPRERVPTIAVGRDLHGFLMLTRMGDGRSEALSSLRTRRLVSA